MKGDFSRLRFDKEKHYSNVLMQQGRVQLDSDWNEQQYIQQHRIETGARDIIGLCGTPENDPSLKKHNKERNSGFKITLIEDNKLHICEGHYYLNGIFCENENDIAYTGQEDFFDEFEPVDVLTKSGTNVGIIYLDVWKQHITAVEDPNIREKALGGRDTTTRIKTIWQVKMLPINNVNTENATCDTEFDEWDDIIDSSTGKMNVQISSQDVKNRPCSLKPETGYSRLENQLYHIEVHKSGDRDNATFKWSRENGSIVASIKKRDEKDGNKVIVEFAGNDDVRGFKPDQWVEILDDKMDLNDQRGNLVQIASVESTPNETDIKIKLKTYPDFDVSRHPKLRRWDQSGESANGLSMKSGFISIENGIEVEFSDGSYKSGDYWLIPARAMGEKGEIEWPYTEPQPPLGIKHHLCRLALLKKDEGWKIEDCRKLFPAVTELTSLFYISGDGQEAMPDFTNSDKLVHLAQPLKVGVANGRWPVMGAKVLFHIEKGNGELQINNDSLTDEYGIAGCEWKLDAITQSQQVKVMLFDAENQPIHLPIIFTANLSEASQVAYDPSACNNLRNTKTVQDAIDKFCGNVTIYYVSGDGQEVKPNSNVSQGVKLKRPLQVRAANGKWPFEKAEIKFSIKIGTGILKHIDKSGNEISGNEITVTTDKDGIAECDWELDSTTQNQNVEAILLTPEPLDTDGNFINIPVRFNASLSKASQVAYNPARCTYLAGVNSVQEAIDQLCRPPSIRIENVFIQEKVQLLNDTNITIETLAKGIRIECITENLPSLIIEKISPAICYVTLDIPFPISKADVEVWGSGLIGFQPLILDANPAISENFIEWKPTTYIQELLPKLKLFEALKRFGNNAPKRILAHLTLKGNFIWAKNKSELYLDGEVFGSNKGDRENINAHLPSGDGRRGGDFEMWFWIVKEIPEILEFKLDPAEVIGGKGSVGTVNLSGPAPESDNLIKLESNPKLVEIPQEVIVKGEGDSVTFNISTSIVKSDTPVNIKAFFNNKEYNTSLNLQQVTTEKVKKRLGSMKKKDSWRYDNLMFRWD